MNIKRLNAIEAFDQLISELARSKKAWTPTQRMQYNRVVRFLKGK